MKFYMSTMAAKNEMLALESVLSRLEHEAAKVKIKKIQCPINDNIFSICSVVDFKNACIRTLKNIQIILINPLQTIDDNNERWQSLIVIHWLEAIAARKNYYLNFVQNIIGRPWVEILLVLFETAKNVN